MMPVGNLAKKIVWQMSPFSGHKVAGLNSSQADNPVVCSTVAHHTDALNRQEDNESLADFVIPTCIAKFFNEDRISFSQKIGVFAFNSAENTNAEAGGQGKDDDKPFRQAVPVRYRVHELRL